jgi:sporulation protein YlmC with PRC-barrel domain
METNETILTREVVALDDRKKLGKVKGLRVDPDTRAVSHYIIGSASTGSDLVLPFNNALAVGDTFLTIQNTAAVLPTVAPEANKLLQEGYALLKSEVYSRTGNSLGNVVGFDFDPVFGKVTQIALATQSFDAANFVFFSPEFVFVDDGAPTAGDLRLAPPEEAAPAAPVEDIFAPTTSQTPSYRSYTAATAAGAAAETESISFGDEPADDSSIAGTTIAFDAVGADDLLDAVVAEVEAESDDNNDFLIGMIISEDVTSDDGEFSVAKGTTLTAEIIEEAKKHEAAIAALTLAVED